MMRYNRTNGRIEISVTELVWFARKRTAVTYVPEEEEVVARRVGETRRLQLTGHRDPVTLTLDCECGDTRYTVTAMADDTDGRVITMIYELPTHPDRPSQEAVAQARGEAFCAAHILSESCGGNYQLRILYVSGDTPTPCIVGEEPKAETTARFFNRLLGQTAQNAAPEIDRVTRRLPTLAAATFPFGQVRSGQRELMELTHAAIRRGTRLYACAPTGTGKTVSVLYPALRALGEGHCDKVFYLTPKGTVAAAAAETIELLHRTGAEVRAVVLCAKDTICPRDTMCRRREKCGLSPLAPTREDAAARALLARGAAVIRDTDILAAAEEWHICPYELSLRYSQYCDVIICDYNYLFDPRVALKRYFCNPGRYAFLIDEAHNLVDRVRRIFGTEMSMSRIDREIAAFAAVPSVHSALIAFRTFFNAMLHGALRGEIKEIKDGGKVGFAASKDLPDGYCAAVCELAYAVEEACADPTLQARLGELRPLCYTLRDLLDKLMRYEEHFTTFMTLQGGDLTCRTVCLDPSALVDERLSLGAGAVLFSATLTPISYYRTVLGGRKNSREVELPSPYDEKNLCVAVMDKVSTRYLERENTVRAVVRTILTAVKAKPGNYMVFCPSYHYMMRLHAALHAAVPKLTTLVQTPHMSGEEREKFLASFEEHSKTALVGFCVMGGIYAEGVDLVGRRLIGAVIVGVGLPGLSDEREAMTAYFDEKYEEGRAYAYVYPGMNRVLQAAGRVIRCESDRGVVLLIDDRFGQPEYRRLIPAHWSGLRYVGDGNSLTHLLGQFWGGEKP